MTSKKGFKFLEHVTDVEFESYGKSYPEALENAAAAMFASQARVEKIKPTKKLAIKETARNLEELALFTLSDLLSQSDAKVLYFKKFKIDSFKKTNTEYSLSGTAFGAPQKPELYKVVVKAVTLHGEKVEQKNGAWMLRLLLDI